MKNTWDYATTVYVTVGPKGGEDEVEVDVLLTVTATSGCAAHYDKSYGWQPPEDAEIELDAVQIKEGKTYRKSDKIADMAVISAAEAWFDDNAGKVLDSYEPDYREDAA